MFSTSLGKVRSNILKEMKIIIKYFSTRDAAQKFQLKLQFIYAWLNVIIRPIGIREPSNTNLSHAPPKWGALGAWKFHSVFVGAQKFCTLSSFSCLRRFKSSLLTKLIPLSPYILCGLPCRAMNLFKAIMKWSVDRSSTSSRWQALVAMQTNQQPYTLTSLLSP